MRESIRQDVIYCQRGRLLIEVVLENNESGVEGRGIVDNLLELVDDGVGIDDSAGYLPVEGVV